MNSGCSCHRGNDTNYSFRCELRCCGLSNHHSAWEGQRQSVAVLVDKSALVCQCDFLAAEAAGFELCNTHFTLVTKGKRFHVAEHEEWIAYRVAEAVDA